MGFLQNEWGWTVVLDLFLGGMGAAVFFVAAIAELAGKDDWREVKLASSWIAVACLAVGVTCLLLDVGQPLRAMLLPASFHNFASSWMAWGAWFMLGALLSSGAYAVLSSDGLIGRLVPSALGNEKFVSFRRKAFKVLAVVGGCFGAAVTAYTGFLVSGGSGVPFWSTPLLPATFVAASFLAGVAVVGLLARLRMDQASPTVAVGLPAATAVLSALFGASLWGYLGAYAVGNPKAAASCEALFAGPHSTLLWVAVVGCGVFVPMALSLALLVRARGHRRSPSVDRVLSALVVVSVVVAGLSWRYIVLALGVHGALVSPDPLQMHEGVSFLLMR